MLMARSACLAESARAVRADRGRRPQRFSFSRGAGADVRDTGSAALPSPEASPRSLQTGLLPASSEGVCSVQPCCFPVCPNTLAPGRLDQGPPPWPHFTSGTSIKAFIFKFRHISKYWGLGLLRPECGGGTQFSPPSPRPAPSTQDPSASLCLMSLELQRGSGKVRLLLLAQLVTLNQSLQRGASSSTASSSEAGRLRGRPVST